MSFGDDEPRNQNTDERHFGHGTIIIRNTTNSEQQEYSRILYHSGQTLLTIINDILDFSKIEAGKLSMKYSL